MARVSDNLAVEVAYAGTNQQLVISLEVPPGTTLSEAVARSGMVAQFPELAGLPLSLGVFGKLEKQPQQRLLQGGERIEIYRPLLIDPKQARRRRAQRQSRRGQK